MEEEEKQNGDDSKLFQSKFIVHVPNEIDRDKEKWLNWSKHTIRTHD